MYMKTTKLLLKQEIRNNRKKDCMKCLECSRFQIKEILLCEVPGCPLWEERPKEAKGLHTLVKQLRQKNNDVSEAEE